MGYYGHTFGHSNGMDGSRPKDLAAFMREAPAPGRPHAQQAMNQDQRKQFLARQQSRKASIANAQETALQASSGYGPRVWPSDPSIPPPGQQPSLSSALAERARFQAMDAQARAEAAMALARQAAEIEAFELEALKRNMYSMQRNTKDAAIAAAARASAAFDPSPMMGLPMSIYPNLGVPGLVPALDPVTAATMKMNLLQKSHLFPGAAPVVPSPAAHAMTLNESSVSSMLRRQQQERLMAGGISFSGTLAAANELPSLAPQRWMYNAAPPTPLESLVKDREKQKASSANAIKNHMMQLQKQLAGLAADERFSDSHGSVTIERLQNDGMMKGHGTTAASSFPKSSLTNPARTQTQGPLKKRLKQGHRDTESISNLESTNSSIRLFRPDDHHWLSDQLCFVRNLIEIFEASEVDVEARSRRGGMKRPIQVGRVGLRCVYCSGIPARQRSKGAVSYPNSIRIIHQSVRNFQRYHLLQCPNMPESVKKEYKSLKTTRCHSGNASLQYWVTSSLALGLQDTGSDDGMRLHRQVSTMTKAVTGDPTLPTEAQKLSTKESTSREGQRKDDAGVLEKKADNLGDGVGPSSSSSSSSQAACDLGAVSAVTDKPVAGSLPATRYLGLILSQQQPTEYQPSDSLGKRRPRPIGFPGMECKHCASPARVASPGRYFPLTFTVLANNNNPSGCVFIHLMKCGRCPPEIKRKLRELGKKHAAESDSLERGWRRKLFDAIWTRLHGESAPGKSLGDQETEKRQGGSNQGGTSESATEPEVGSVAMTLSALSTLSGQKRKATDGDGDEIFAKAAGEELGSAKAGCKESSK